MKFKFNIILLLLLFIISWINIGDIDYFDSANQINYFEYKFLEVIWPTILLFVLINLFFTFFFYILGKNSVNWILFFLFLVLYWFFEGQNATFEDNGSIEEATLFWKILETATISAIFSTILHGVSFFFRKIWHTYRNKKQ